MKYRIPRRDFLRQGALAAAAALAAPARAGAGLTQSADAARFARTSAPRKVVVLGAGPAGLSAGYELSRAGHEVTLLKAQGRPGARRLAEQTLPGARDAFERGFVKCWGEDEWAGCAWTHPSPAQLVHVNAPEGRVHFAGERGSSHPSWMNGALESGNAVARAVDAAARAEAGSV